jgi:ABC-type antimicrobial peptide transport system permease subunit
VLGASPAGLRLLVVRQALRDVARGVAAGGVISALAAWAMERSLGGLDWSDGRMSVLAVAVLAFAAAAASFIPALRASRADPAAALQA